MDAGTQALRRGRVRRRLRRAARKAFPVVLVACVTLSAIVTKELRARGQRPAPLASVSIVDRDTSLVSRAAMLPPSPLRSTRARPAPAPVILSDPTLRFFNGRAVRPARVLWMTVTAYSPDERSCPGTADGITSTLHCVTTNGHMLVAADPEVLPMGTILSIPGYGVSATGGKEPVLAPVLDVGGAIKGQRLDVLYPTHEEALRWGVRLLPVTVWEYADGTPRENPRRAR